MRIITFLVIFAAFIQFDAKSQTSTSISASVTVIRPLTLTNLDYNTLHIGDLPVLPTPYNFTLSNANGHKILATGEPGRTISVNFTTSFLIDNYAWVAVNGGTNNTLTINVNNPIVQTGLNSTWTNPQNISNGGTVTLQNDNGVGKCHFWVGGSIFIPGNSPNGFYTGNFVMTVAY